MATYTKHAHPRHTQSANKDFSKSINANFRTKIALDTEAKPRIATIVKVKAMKALFIPSFVDSSGRRIQSHVSNFCAVINGIILKLNQFASLFIFNVELKFKFEFFLLVLNAKWIDLLKILTLFFFEECIDIQC